MKPTMQLVHGTTVTMVLQQAVENRVVDRPEQDVAAHVPR